MPKSRRPFGLAAMLAAALGCAFSMPIEIRTEPPGARVWLGRDPVGPSPVRVEAKATGPIEGYTFDPQYVTIELEGYERQVRTLQYEWSPRNILWSLPLVLGMPGILLWSKVPTDLEVVLRRHEPDF